MNVVDETHNKAVAYAEAYLESFTSVIDKYYKTPVTEIIELGFPLPRLSLYNKKLVRDLIIKVFCSDHDFDLFFENITDKDSSNIVINKCGDIEYGDEWHENTPRAVKTDIIRKLLGVKDVGDFTREVSIPGGCFIEGDIGYIASCGKLHGSQGAQMVGDMAIRTLPKYRDIDINTKTKLEFGIRYRSLADKRHPKTKEPLSEQKVGHEFEKLVRDVLNHYGWQTEKIIIEGEGNDFTAIYNGNHILGEVRWKKDEVKNEEVNAFAGKLTPRPQTIGLMISHGGFNKGALLAQKRLSASRTIIFWGKDEIEKIIINLGDPGDIFSKLLREAYDYLFEKSA